MSIIEKALCRDCGNELEVEYLNVLYDGDLTIKVEPCWECVAVSENHAEAVEEAKEEGYEEGESSLKRNVLHELRCLKVTAEPLVPWDKIQKIIDGL